MKSEDVPMLICPYCSHEFELTWKVYAKAPFGMYVCPGCGKTCKSKFTLGTPAFIGEQALLLVIIVVVVTGVMILGALLTGVGAIFWSPLLGLILGLAVALPFDKWADTRFRRLIAPIEEVRAYWASQGCCPVCHEGVAGRETIQFDDIKVCAACKDHYVQEIVEGKGKVEP